MAKSSMKVPAFIQKAFEQAREARLMAYAPYSAFQVGAAVLAGGKTTIGCNVENASYGATVCAERTAIWRSVIEGRKNIENIVVVTDAPEPAYPCALCLQVMAEFLAPDSRIWVADTKEIRSSHAFAELLPHRFGPNELNEANAAKKSKTAVKTKARK